MSSWFSHLLVGSVGLAFTALLARVLLVGWKREPLASYRLLRVVLAVALVLPALQLGVHGARLPGGDVLAAWLASISWNEAPNTTGLKAAGEILEEPVLLSAPELERVAFSSDSLEGLTPTSGGHGPVDSSPAPPVELSTEPAVPSTRGFSRFWQALALVYVTGLVLRLAWTAIRIVRTKTLLERARPVRDRATLDLWEGIRASSPIGSKVELLCTPDIRVPMCSGLGRPVILLPRRGSCAPSADVLRCVLLHELVHLERRDGWVVLAQELLRAPFWFHPAAKWLSRQLDLFRELSCDARVALRTGHPKRYAAALVEYAEWMQRQIRTPHLSSTALLPWTTTRGQLSRRIEMLLNRSTARPAGLRRFMVGGAFAFLPFVWGGQLALASCLSHAQGAHFQETCPHGCDATAAVPSSAVAPVAAIGQHPEPPPPPHAGGVARPRTSAAQAPHLWRQEHAGVAPSQGGGHGVAVFAQGQELPMIGLELGTPGEGELSGIDVPHEQVLAIQGVVRGSLAERSGIESGDVIVQVEGGPATLDNLNAAKRHLSGGQIVIQIVRDGESRDIVIDGHDLKLRREPARVGVLPGNLIQVQPFVVEAIQNSGEAIERAREAIQRALEAQPDNEALREAMDALGKAQADAISGFHVYGGVHPASPGVPAAPDAVPGFHVYERTHLAPPPAPAAPEAFEPMKFRRFELEQHEATGEGIRRKVEEFQRNAERRQVYVDMNSGHEHDAHTDRARRDAELRELRELLETRRRELEELRARLEALRTERHPEGSLR